MRLQTRSPRPSNGRTAPTSPCSSRSSARRGTPESLLAAPVASFAYPESAARALGRAAERSEWLRAPQGRVPELGGIDPSRALSIVREAGDRWLTADETRSLLDAYRVPVVPE